MQVVSFIWHAKYGHFLRAEANKNALTYLVPPKTAILGLLGAILGLEKDAPQERLSSLQVAIMGAMPRRFWHRIKFRKDPPAPLSMKVSSKDKGSAGEEKATLLNQEWLWRPSYLIYVALPDHRDLFDVLVNRLKDARYHFTPSMGLSEMIAAIEFQELFEAQLLPTDEYEISSICPQPLIKLSVREDRAIHMFRMPIAVSPERIFQHESVYVEREGRPIKGTTSHATKVGNNNIILF